ncbi:MAG TPA: molybdopterin cofactor-binding domain-containing protein [Acidimicrobiia bacterium]
MTTDVITRVRDVVGTSPPRPDGVPKLTGQFEYVSDLTLPDTLWGATRRVETPRARIVGVDVRGALAVPGVWAVLLQSDVPGHPYQGQIRKDQPVLAENEIRHWGQAIAVVAAEDSDTAHRAAQAIEVELEDLEPVLDLVEALERNQVFRHVPVHRGDPTVRGEVAVIGYYETGPVDQAALGTEAGLAIPDGQGGVDIWGPSQWIHVDHPQIADCLGLRAEQVRVHPVGLGGAFGSREDLSVQVHLGMLALHTGRPVRMVLDRQESFAAHVKRHASRMWYRHEAGRGGDLVKVEATILLDGGAYMTTTDAVIANAVYFAAGPYRCPNTFVEGYALRTNHPPSGAMRGFGANQVCFAYEAQMDKLAAALGMDPVELRVRNALAPGDRLPTTGQVLREPLPTAEVIRSVAALPLPDEPADDPLHLPGGTGLTTDVGAVVRGVGYAVGIKNLGFAEGFDDYADAKAVLSAKGLEIHTAAIEVGQGMVTILGQIARTVSGLDRVAVVFDHTGTIGSAGSTSASRQTQMAGGAVHRAVAQLRDRILKQTGGDRLSDEGVWANDRLVMTLDEVCAGASISEEVRFRHPPTRAPDEDGQGELHADFCVAAHRAVVDVDPELGLVRVVRVDTAQDVGKALHPQQVLGQIEGGIAQGLGMAYLEELTFREGVATNANFTDYLLPTILDMAEVEAVLVEQEGGWGPFGAKGFAELPSVSSGPAVVAAIRAATGRDLSRIPVRPQDISGISPSSTAPPIPVPG